MGRYAIQNTETLAIKKSLKKWGEVPVNNQHIKGTLKIKNYRKYKSYEEIDVVFEGQIFVRVYRDSKKWRDSSLLKTNNISIIKLNRFLRKTSLFELQTRMKYFGVDIRSYYEIKKIKWQ